MKKLGLIIKNTFGGEQQAFSVNEEKLWADYAVDARTYIKEFTPKPEGVGDTGNVVYFDGSERSAIFVKFLGVYGYLICIVIARPEGSGRANDNTAAWIHVPAEISLSGKDTCDLIDQVEEAIAQEQGIDNDVLETLFAKEYVENKYVSAVSAIASNGEKCAVRYYGSGTDFHLAELFGENVAQQEYGKYKGVFFLKKSDNFAFNGPVINARLSVMCVVYPPIECDGFKPYWGNNTAFDCPVQVEKGAQLSVVWKKMGFKDIATNIVVPNNLSTEESTKKLAFKHNEIQFRLVRDQFMVQSVNGHAIGQYSIRIGGRDFFNEMFFPIDKIRSKEKIHITAEGYKTKAFEIVLDPSKSFVIEMQRMTYEYHFSVPVYDGNEEIGEGDLVISGLSHRFSESPLPGYSLMGNRIEEGEHSRNHLEYNDTWSSIRHFLYGFASFALILFLWMGWNALNEAWDKYELCFGLPPYREVSTGAGETEEVKGHEVGGIKSDEVNPDNTDTRREDAIVYLNQNPKWNKDEMAQYPCLEGLFDDMNNYNLENLSGKWADEFANEVKNMKIMQESAKKAIKNKHILKAGIHPSDTYNNDPNDHVITVLPYIYWIDQNHSSNSVTSSTSSTTTSGGSSGSNHTGSTTTSGGSSGSNHTGSTTTSGGSSGSSGTSSTSTSGSNSNGNSRGENFE